MQTFCNLSPRQSKDLVMPLYINAKDLYQNAELIAEANKSYSKATSLMILSLEECIKAILVRLHSEGLKVYRIEGVQKFVGDHKLRHQVAQLIETGAGFIEVFEKWEEEKNRPKQFKAKWLNTAQHGLNAILQFHFSAKRIEKLQRFNDIKNSGLYVGYNDGILDPAVIVTEDDYNEVKGIVDRVFRFYRLINYIYAPSQKGAPVDPRKKEFRKQFTIFVDEALSGFSFKELSEKK